jgi:hypothetical protein
LDLPSVSSGSPSVKVALIGQVQVLNMSSVCPAYAGSCSSLFRELICHLKVFGSASSIWYLRCQVSDHRLSVLGLDQFSFTTWSCICSERTSPSSIFSQSPHQSVSSIIRSTSTYVQYKMLVLHLLRLHLASARADRSSICSVIGSESAFVQNWFNIFLNLVMTLSAVCRLPDWVWPCI